MPVGDRRPNSEPEERRATGMPGHGIEMMITTSAMPKKIIASRCLRAASVGLADLDAPDVHERDADDHAGEMLDREEARGVDLHRGGEIAEARSS